MAGRIPQSFIDNLLDRTEIVDLIGSRVDLKKAGVSYKACCPFHNEKTPSFIVNPVKQFYHCYGCGANGSAISFLMEYDHLSFPEAIEELAAMAGLEVPRENYDGPAPSTQSPLYDVVTQCAAFFQRALREHPPAIEYLKQRGLSGETAKTFGIGYAPNAWDSMSQHVSGCSETHLLASGMLIKNENGKIYDRFRDRVMFPIRDRRGRIIGFGGRLMDGGEPKYLNSPETDIFRKGEELYGLFEARQSNRNLDSLLVVEGYMDVIGLSQHGISNAVATLGTATTPEHMERLFRTVNDVVFCFDGDRAGKQAAWRALKNTLPALQDGREARFLFLADGEDPDSLVKTAGKDAFLALLDDALPTADFLFQSLIGDGGLQSIGNRTRLAESAKPLIKTIPGEVYRTLLFQQLSDLVGTRIHRDADFAFARESTGSAQKQNDSAVQLSPMRSAVRLVLQYPDVVDADDIDHYQFDEDQPGGYVLQKLIGIVLGQPGIRAANLLEKFRDSSEWGFLRKLATQPIPGIEDDDAARAKVMFLGSVKQLAKAQQRRGDAALRALAAGSDLDDELKAQLRARIPYSE
ncbi:MAG: DNA primase [Pseudomonadota bacterium]